MITVDNPDQLKDKLDTSIDCPLQRSVSTSMLRSFTALSDDQSPIHDADSADPIVPGNLLISLMPAMLQSGLVVKSFDHCKTVALDKVRFYHIVSVNQTLRLSARIISVRTRGNSSFVVTELELICVEQKRKILSAEQTDCYVV